MSNKDIYPIIGILSDTHNRIELQNQLIDKFKECGVTHILHAGDFETIQALNSLADCGLPYACVFGNNDYALKSVANQYRIKSEPYYIKISDLKIKMMHLPYYMTPDSDIIVYGHLHKFHSSIEGNTLYINPGEVCGRETGMVEGVVLYRSSNKYIVEHYFKDIDKIEWNSKVYIYQTV